MANRHHDKKLRAEIRARMAATGEPYQKARAQILSRTATPDEPRMGLVIASRDATPGEPRTDLVPFSYFGIPATLATLEKDGLSVAVVVPSSKLWGKGYPHPFPPNILRALMHPRGVQ